MTIRDEPTVEQHNKNLQYWYAEVAFNAILRSDDSDNAKKWLIMLSNEALDRLVQLTKKLTLLAEAEQRERQARKAK